MEDYRLPSPLVAFLKASHLQGLPDFSINTTASKVEVKLSWDLAAPAPMKVEKKEPRQQTDVKTSLKAVTNCLEMKFKETPPPIIQTIIMPTRAKICPSLQLLSNVLASMQESKILQKEVSLNKTKSESEPLSQTQQPRKPYENLTFEKYPYKIFKRFSLERAVTVKAIDGTPREFFEMSHKFGPVFQRVYLLHDQKASVRGEMFFIVFRGSAEYKEAQKIFGTATDFASYLELRCKRYQIAKAPIVKVIPPPGEQLQIDLTKS